MSELRQDRTSGAWVIVAPERGGRPLQAAGHAVARPILPHRDPGCPFCPGSEAALAGIIEEVASEAPPGWQLRVVPNKFPALRDDGAGTPAGHSGRVLAGFGRHEVVIESARHDVDLPEMSEGEIAIVMAAYRRRFVELARPPIECVVLFRNHGSTSGASLLHPHAQLIALAMTPPEIRRRQAWAEAWHRDTGRCALCEEVALERKRGERVITETGHFVAAVPFAASSPCEMWLMPKRHCASLAAASEAEIAELGPVLQDLLARLRRVHDDPPYRLVLDSAGPGQAGRPDQHWRIRLVPVLTTAGGFELASGMPINPSRPEEDAEGLRRGR